MLFGCLSLHPIVKKLNHQHIGFLLHLVIHFFCHLLRQEVIFSAKAIFICAAWSEDEKLSQTLLSAMLSSDDNYDDPLQVSPNPTSFVTSTIIYFSSVTFFMFLFLVGHPADAGVENTCLLSFSCIVLEYDDHFGFNLRYSLHDW